MGFFRKEPKVVDLSESLRRRQEKLSHMKSEIAEEKKAAVPETQSSSGGFSPFGFFDTSSYRSSASSSTAGDDLGESAEEKRSKLAKRLMDMTNKIEDLSNQIYHLQQRVELLERKLDVNRF